MDSVESMTDVGDLPPLAADGRHNGRPYIYTP